jgi:fructose-bisphosphate aldolase class II
MEAAKKVNSPVMIQLSNGGAAYYAGKGMIETKPHEAAILGGISAALHVHTLAEHYGIPVILHTDHCAKKLLPWVDGLLEAGEKYFAKHGKPLFSSHMLDLSEETHEENMKICREYLARMSKIGMLLEIEIGITGGEEEGVDNTDAHPSKLYTTKEDIDYVYEQLSPISSQYSVAAAFGNVHGVYKVGNVELKPEILKEGQEYVKAKHKLSADKPITYVFHGGSGSDPKKIAEALNYGVVKMNIDTDVQWAAWDGVREYEAANRTRLQGQLGIAGTDDHETPNKAFYDPRKWMRKSEEAIIARLEIAFKELNCLNRYK